jgi:hypothetical protein
MSAAPAPQRRATRDLAHALEHPETRLAAASAT